MDLRSKTIKYDVKQKIIGSQVLSLDTYGKNILISFSRNVHLRNHMMTCTCVSGSVGANKLVYVVHYENVLL